VIDQMFCATAEYSPDADAIIFGERRISYAELTGQIAGFRRGLSRLGIGSGDRVLVALPNCPEFIVAYFATAGLNALVQAIDPNLTEHECRRRLGGSPPAIAITTAESAAFFGQFVVPATSGSAVVAVGDQDPGSPFPSFASVANGAAGSGNDVAAGQHRGPSLQERPWVVAFSSGSTGEPKRVLRSVANQIAEAEHIVTSAHVTPADVIVCPLPLHHAFGQTCCMLVAARAGATLVLLRENPSRGAPAGSFAGQIIDLVQEHRATILAAVPYVFEALADIPAGHAADFSSVRLCVSGSNFLRPEVRDRFQARFGVAIRQTYGSSEAGSVCWDCDPGEVASDTVGRPLTGVTVQILGEDGDQVPPGAVGEIVVESDAVMLGYDGEPVPERTGPGLHPTGDLGSFDESGRLTLVGRKRLLVDVGGDKVNPVEVEEVLESHPMVAAAAVVGMPMRGSTGNLLVAAVVPLAENRPSEQPDADALRAYCRGRLASYKVPGRFEFVGALPRSPLGKVLRTQVAELISGREDGHEATRDPARALDAIWLEQDLAARAELITRALKEQVAAITGLASGRLDRATPLRELGLDSLGALRLKMAIQDDLRRFVGLPELLDGASIHSLAIRLARNETSVTPLEAGSQREGEFPLSPSQLAIWQADQLEPDSAAYNQNFAANLVSGCDVEALRRAFDALANRHPVLRTTFFVRDGAPWQRVAPRAAVDFEVVPVPATWDSGNEADREILDAEARRPFCLERDRPMRVRLFRGGARGPVLLVTTHHVITDFWSLVALLGELKIIYAAETAGARADLPPLSHSYTDYGRWLTRAIDGTTGEQDWRYWREQLTPAPPALELPAGNPRPPVQSRLGSTLYRELDSGCVEALREFARATGSTVYAALFAIFHLLLYANTGERDLAVAAITTNRQRSEFLGVLGYFVNPVVCRTQVAEDRGFTDLLASVEAALRAGVEHQLLPFGTIIERLGTRRDRSRAPLVEVAFGQNKAHDTEMLAVSRFLSGGSRQRLRLGRLDLEPVPLRHQGAVYDFSGAVYEAEDSISIAWQYNSALMRPETAERLARQFQHLLRTVLQAPGRPVRDLPLLEECDLLADSSPEETPPPSLLDALAGQAASHPAATALVTGSDTLTNAELDLRSGRLACRIRAAGPASGALAGLWLDDDTQLAVAGLAALKAGAVVDAMAADDPAELVQRMLDDDGAGLLITTQARLRRLPGWDRPVICVDLAPEPADQAGADTGPGPGSPGGADPAMVLRTSGTTAPSRAVMADHTSLSRYARWVGGQVRPGEQVLVHRGRRPDRRLARLLAAVAAGGTAVLTTAAGPRELARLLCSGRPFDHVEMTPAELAMTLQHIGDGPHPPGVGTLSVGGQTLAGELADEWRRHAGPHARIVHYYGGAEIGLVVSAGEVPADRLTGRIVPAGRPVPGIERHVLDSAGRQCPVGVPGEICVTAAAVARPVTGHEPPSGRLVTPAGKSPLYRTGDVGVRLPDGGVAILGRGSRMVRVRGYRVDLGEVERALRNLGVVGSAVAAADGDAVTAVCAPRPSVAADLVTGPALRGALRQVLPEYMVPARITVAEDVRWASNGKLAFSPAGFTTEDAGPADSTAGRDGPLAVTEARLATIWKEVLGVDQVTPEDDYFDLGGDSVTGMRIVFQAAEAGITITLQSLFIHSVLRDLAVAAEVTGGESAGPRAPGPARVVPAAPVPRTVPLTPVQQWFFALDLANVHHWNQSILLAVDPSVTPEVLRRALALAAAAHPAFRLRFTRADDGWEQRFDPAAEPLRVLGHEAADQPGALDEAVAHAHALVNLTTGPVLVATILPGNDGQRTRLLLVAHHLVIDFVSWQILVDDLARACLEPATDPTAPSGTASFTDWADRLTGHAGSGAVLAELGRWVPDQRSVAAGPGGPRAARPAELHTRVITVTLPPAHTAAFARAVAAMDGARPHEVVLAAVVQAVADWSGQREVRVDVEGHGRHELFADLDVSRTVGWFTSVYPVHFSIGTGDALAAVRDSVPRTPGGDLTYGLLRYACPDLAVRARMAEVPPATVNFNYLGALGQLLGGHDQTMDRHGLFTPLPLSPGRDRDPGNARPYQLEISAALASGELRINVNYSASEHKREDIRDLTAKITNGILAITRSAAAPAG
jgi:non-ribosomal peptide synthase protein (TIGR01720 family)